MGYNSNSLRQVQGPDGAEALEAPQYYQFPNAQCAVACLARNCTKHPHSAQVIWFTRRGHPPQISSRLANSCSPQKSATGSAAAISSTSSGVISIEANSFLDSQTGQGSDIIIQKLDCRVKPDNDTIGGPSTGSGTATMTLDCHALRARNDECL